MRRYVPRFRFNPYSFDELWKPVEYATQVHRDVQDKLSANEMAAAEFLSYIDKDKDPVPYQIAQNYLASIDTAARDLNTKGLGSVGYARLMGLNSEYAHNVKPIENAVKNQQAYIAAQRQLKASNPSIAFVRDGSQMKLDEFKNGQPDLTYVDGNKVKQDAAMMAQALFSKKFTGMSKQKFDHYNDLVLMRYGMSLEDMIKNPNTNQSYNMMMNAVFEANGVDNLNEQEQYRMKQLFDQGVTIGAAVTEQAQIVDNGNKFREQQAAAAAARHRATQTKLKDMEDMISNMKKAGGVKTHGEATVKITDSSNDKIKSFEKLIITPSDYRAKAAESKNWFTRAFAYAGPQMGPGDMSYFEKNPNSKNAITTFLNTKDGKEFIKELCNKDNYNDVNDYMKFLGAAQYILEPERAGTKKTHLSALGKSYNLNNLDERNNAFYDLMNAFYQKQTSVTLNSGGFELEQSSGANEKMVEETFKDIHNDSPGGGTIIQIKENGKPKKVTVDDSFFKDNFLANSSICLEPQYAGDGYLTVYADGKKFLINIDQVGLSHLREQMTRISSLNDRANQLISNNNLSVKEVKDEINGTDKHIGINESIRDLSEQVLKNLRQVYLYNRASSSFFEKNDPNMVEFDYYSNPENRALEGLIMLESQMQASGEY